MAAPTNMSRLEVIVATLPEAERVDVEEWGDHPTFRVRGKLVARKRMAKLVLDEDATFTGCADHHS